MTDESTPSQESGASLIEIRLNSVRQLFNSLDPSPFHEQDLDSDAEEYIVETVRELPPNAAIKIRILLPDRERVSAETVDLAQAVRNYFAYRLWATRSRLRDLMRRGRDTLAVALAFLALTFAIREAIYVTTSGTIAEFLAEGLQIVGWVALWQPVQIFLYEWQPIRRMIAVYRRLSMARVETRFL